LGRGKTHLAIALGVEATQQKRRVLFTRAADLVRPSKNPSTKSFFTPGFATARDRSMTC